MSIDPQSPIPLYAQLRTLLVEQMLQGTYGPGDRLPTEQELCETYGVSRTPVTRALSELAEQGLVLRHPGRGTFVNPHRAPRRLDRTEVRVVVPAEGPWESIINVSAPSDLDINVVAVPRADLHHTLTHAVAEGQAPDLAVLDSVWVPEFASGRFLHALEEIDLDWIHNEHETDFLPVLVSAGRYRGQTFAVSAVADVAGVWYRRDLGDGHPPPQTWDQLVATARTLAKSGVPQPIVMPAGSRGGETTSYCLIALLASNGAAVIDGGVVTLDSPQTTETLLFVRDLVASGLLLPGAVGYEWNRAPRLLAQGNAGFTFGGSYEALALAELLDVPFSELTNHLGFRAVPAGARGQAASVTGTMVYGIFRQASQPKQAMRLLRHVVDSASLTRVAVETGRIPPRLSAIERAAQQSRFVADTSQILRHATTRPATPHYPQVSAQLATMLEGVLTGRFTAAVAAERTAEMIGAITGLPVVRHNATIPSTEPIG